MSYKSKLDSREAWLKRLKIYWDSRSYPHFITRVGEIYEIDFGENPGTEFSGRHLGLCLSDTSPSQEKMLVIPITSKFESYNIAPEDMIQTKALWVNKTIEGGVSLSEARWISKLRVFSVSKILSEPDTVVSPVKGMVDVSRKQLMRWKKL